MRYGYKILMISSLLATIGSFLIDALPFINGFSLPPPNAATPDKNAQQLLPHAEKDRSPETLRGITRICLLTILVCGAGITVIRIIRASGPDR